MFALALISAAFADCPADTASLRALVERAGTQQEARSWDAFDATVQQVHGDVRCLRQVLDVEGAYRLHELEARLALSRSDWGLSTRAFQGVLATSPGFTLPATFPANHPWRQALEGARTAPDPRAPLPPGTWLVDGQLNARSVPTARVALVQRVGDSGEVLGSWYLLGGPLPPELIATPSAAPVVTPPAPEPVLASLPTASPPPSFPVGDRPARKPPSPTKRAVWVAAGVSTALGAVAGTVGVVSYLDAQGEGAGLDATEWADRRTLNHAANGAAIGFYALGAVAGGVALFGTF